MMELKAMMVLQDHREQQAHKETPDHKELKVLQVQQEHRVIMVLKEI